MEFGYSSSASSSPDPRAFALPLIYDTTPDSSTPTSPDELQHMMYYNQIPSYGMAQYQTNLTTAYETAAPKLSPDFQELAEPEVQDRRRKRTGNASKDKGNSTNMHLRRRAQNRASQRAFRERKERHLKGLEGQLSDLYEKHQDLLQSYTRQADEVAKLHARIAELTSELSAMRSANGGSLDEMIVPDKFDAVPTSTMLYSGPGFYFDKGALDIGPSAARDNDLL